VIDSTLMLASLSDTFHDTLNSVSMEAEQLSKLTAPSASYQSPSLSNAPSEYRKTLIAKEQAEHQMVKAYKSKIRELTLERAALELENNSLTSLNKQLQWEPSQSRSWMVLLIVWLSSAFTLVLFAIFSIAETHLALEREWIDRVEGRILLLLGVTLVVGAIPLTHLSGQYLYGPRRFQFVQAFKGGNLYVALQALGWTLYSLCLLLAVLIGFQDDIIPWGAVAVSGVSGIVSHVLMVCSLLTFTPQDDEDGYSSSGSTQCASDTDDTQSNISLIRRKHRTSSHNNAENGMEFDLWLDADMTWNRGNGKVRMDPSSTLFAAFMSLQFTLVLMSLGLGFYAEFVSSSVFHKRVLTLLSLMCFIIAAILTHGLGGTLSRSASGWKFFQPFAGGTRFVLLQSLIWALFAICMCSMVSVLGGSLYISSTYTAAFSGLSITQTGFLGVLVHLLMIMSFTYFQKQEFVRNATDGISPHLKRMALDYYCQYVTDSSFLSEIEIRMGRFYGWRSAFGTIWILGLCNTQYVIFAWLSVYFYWTLPVVCMISNAYCLEQPEDTFSAFLGLSLCICIFTLGYSVFTAFNIKGTIKITTLIMLNMVPVGATLSLHYDSSVFPLLCCGCCLFTMYNWRTYSGTPEQTGWREWPSFRKLTFLWDLFQDYHGASLMVDEKLEEFEKRDGAILGSEKSSAQQGLWCFHPHGIFPTTLIWAPNTSMFLNRFPDLSLVAMTATVIHLTPLMRDVAQWGGVRDVGRIAVDNALTKGRSPILVVGGMSEMFLSKSWPNEIAVHKQHRGFVRMSIKHGTPLIPVFSFGEHRTMDNVYLPNVQAWFKKWAGIPIPYFPYGRWFMPMPRRAPITLCVGEPVFPIKKNPNPTVEEIEELHSRYFAALNDMFERNKNKCGFPNHVIEWA